MAEFAGELAEGAAIAPGSSDGTGVVHRKHVLDPPKGEASTVGTFTLPEVAPVGQFYALRLPAGGSVLRAQFQPIGSKRKSFTSCSKAGTFVPEEPSRPRRHTPCGGGGRRGVGGTRTRPGSVRPGPSGVDHLFVVCF